MPRCALLRGLHFCGAISGQVLYTGDYSREDDRHLMKAEIPAHIPDVLIMESTFGTQVTFALVLDKDSYLLCRKYN
jgi:Cft2 family RNA processing exonuclease